MTTGHDVNAKAGPQAWVADYSISAATRRPNRPAVAALAMCCMPPLVVTLTMEAVVVFVVFNLTVVFVVVVVLSL